jgi:hypothetical protein
VEDGLHAPGRTAAHLEVGAISAHDLDAAPHRVEVPEMSRREIVEDADSMALAHQGFRKVASDETGSAGHEDSHISPPRPRWPIRAVSRFKQ